MTADVETPSLQVVEKLKSIPVIESAIDTSAGFYNIVKGSNELVNWVLESAETMIGTAVENVAVPLATTFQAPIATVDAKLCEGIDMLQEKVPIVKEPPGEIYNKAKTYVDSSLPVNMGLQGISNASIKLRDESWNKANELLTSRYGTMALSGFDKTSSIADMCIDYCLPAQEGEEDVHPHSNAECPDKVIHTAHTVGALSGKMGRRVMNMLTRQFSETFPSRMEQNTNSEEEQESRENEIVEPTVSRITPEPTMANESMEVDQPNEPKA